MKKTTIILLAACLQALSGPALLAGPVSEKTAQEIAQRILSAQRFRKGGVDCELVWTGDDPQDQPAMYVFASKGGGFVIISGDDNTVPVLAISDRGSFETDDMPDNVRWWMERMQSQVRATRTVAQSPRVKSQWARWASTRADSWALDANQVTDKEGHLTPEWDQGNRDVTVVTDEGTTLPGLFEQYVFNKYCPLDKNDKQSVSGCVATSIAEVLTTLSGLYPEEMPTSSKNVRITYSLNHSYSSSRVANSPYQLGTTQYDWAGLRTLTNVQAIKDAIAENTPEKNDLIDQLGHLMADCGAIMHAMYSSEGTGAYSEDIPANMAENFYMSKTARMENKSNYTDAQWIRLLKAELALRPVLYSGSTLDGKYGHAFVFDGYGRFGEDDVFHVNFGWRSICNGYYYFDYLKTDEDGETGQEEIWGKDCDAIFSFYPDKNGQTQKSPYLKLYPTYSNRDSYTGISTTSQITPGTSFPLRVGTIKNSGRQNFSGRIVACLKKKDGSLTKIGEVHANINSGASWTVSGSNNNSWWGGGSSQLSCTIPANTPIELGDRIVVCYSTGNNGNNYVEIPYDYDGEVIGEIPLATSSPTPFIKNDNTYHVGDYFTFALENYGSAYAGTTWKITDPDGETVTKPQSYQSYRLSKAGRYKIAAAVRSSANAAVVEHIVMIINVEE